MAALRSDRCGPFVRGLVFAAGVEMLLVFLGLLSVLSPNGEVADSGVGLYLGLGGVLLFYSGLAAGIQPAEAPLVAEPRPVSIR